MFTMWALLKRLQITVSSLNKKSTWALLVVLVFIAFRLSPFFWNNISAIGSYLIEVLFVAFIYTLYKPKIKFQSEKLLKYGVVFLILGASSFLGAKTFNILVPFDFNRPRDIFSLLIIAPILEEFLFRFAYWEPFNRLFKSKTLTLIINSLLFSLSHFVAYFYVPESFHDFVFYQMDWPPF